MTTRAAIYARVSSQAQRDAHTIENQLRALPAFVAAQGWTLAGTYVDDGRSAKTGKLEKRDGFARLLAAAEARRFDVLVVADVDRLTRTNDMRERAAILGPFQRAGIRIVTPTGGELDLRTMLGELYVTMQALVAAEENRKRAERVKAGKARAIAEGRKPAGPTPYGLAYTRATGRWSLDPERADVVREIFRRVIGGESCKLIADDLHVRGVPPPRGPWTRHKVWHIVRSRHVVGEWTADKRTRAVVRVPAIIDEETWQAAQDKLIEHGKRGLRKTRHVYLLEGLATCGTCGEPIAIRSPTPQRRGRVGPAAYVCRARKYDQRGGRCPAPILPVADVDQRVWAIVARALAGPQLAELVARRVEARTANRRDWEADVRRYEAQLDRAERAAAAIAARFRRGLLPEAAFDMELRAAGKERAALAVQLDRARQAARAHDDPQVSPEQWLAVLRGLAETMAPEARQRAVRLLVPPGNVVFADREVEVVLEIDEPAESRSSPRLAAGCRTQHEHSLRIRLVA